MTNSLNNTVPTYNYYLHRLDDSGWEEVDEFVYNKWNQVVMTDGSQRYSGNRMKKSVSNVEVICSDTTHKNLLILMRMLGIKSDYAANLQGYLRKPESVLLRRGKGNGTVLKVIGGDIYKKAG